MTNEAQYLGWLEEQVRPDDAHQWSDLFELLYNKEFVWLVPHDDNRMMDAFELRNEFLPRQVLGGFDRPCSVLEVIVGLGRRMEFIAGGKANRWAWTLCQNLELDKNTKGGFGKIKEKRLHDILDTLIWRRYNADGSGGFFPLAWPQLDQTGVELWYQMNAYIEELPEL